ncbi:hypothetical protein CAL26_06695 [Bordetella genomosp. 9]|uniref:Uncharacterized protein n=1 Tax=Bordetella genomosp. 9 TaxID=1416803 RepID=A0A261RES0_9BORD|nr:hypothetical protein [Bordetella genomosp. 9]OZI23162.1 hypothetical protein CAL26_06695 [Bordetella genomosp. 9]
MAWNTTDADVFIRILVDDLVVTMGQSTGIYFIDSSKAFVSRGSIICWKVEMLNPKSPGLSTIVEVGDCYAWGTTGTPQIAADISDGTAYVGTAETAGTFNYIVSIDVVASTGQANTIKITPTINVS